MASIMLPVIVNIYFLINKNINNPDVLTVIAATLYKQIGTLFNMHSLFTSTMQWSSTYYPKLRALEKSLFPPTKRLNLYSNIKLEKILFLIEGKSCRFHSVKQILNVIDKTKYGRITIRGTNGSGKSTLLCLLKEILFDDAFYLPTNSKFIFESTKEKNFSLGEKMKFCLNELFEVVK